MSTKKCKKCGWVYPATHPELRCKWCKTKFDEFWCKRCGQVLPVSAFGSEGTRTCLKCRKEYTAMYASERQTFNVNTARAQLAGWAESTRDVKDVPLTEQQWLRACMHFGGCALCGAEAIDARTMFVPFKLGGRYTAWNVVPTCEKCALDLKRTQNPFMIFVSQLSNRGEYTPGKVPNAVLKILTYLRDQMPGIKELNNER